MVYLLYHIYHTLQIYFAETNPKYFLSFCKYLNSDQIFPSVLATLSVYHQYSISGLLVLL